jgi:CRISPR-associated nuclease/helicase Cas3-like protein
LSRYPPRDLIRHGTIGARVLPGILAGYGFTSEAAESYARIVAGHHGAIPKRAEITAPQVGPDACGSGEWVRSRQEIVDALAGLSGIARASPPRAPSGPEAMALAGMISVADWIGSMKQSFPFAATDGALPDPFDFDGYAVAAAANAEIAIKELRWVHHAVRDAPKDFKSLFPSIAEPNDLQCVAEQVGEALDGPTLVIIEAPMGEGKTEAALYLAEAAATRLGQTGLYFALPTQATSNQMFSRVREFLTRVLGGEINLQLLHGHADLSAEFQDMREAGARSFTPIYDEYGNPSTTVVAAEWFTYRKRGLLAPFGVGTVDQALMAVLRARHFFVRMFGLGGKTIVIDEVHAYDVYMSTLMERLLEWLAASGSSVFLLSATLPSGRREALSSAYMRGLGVAPQSDTRAVYPRITYASARGSGEIEVTPSARIRRTLGIRWLGHAADLGAHAGRLHRHQRFMRPAPLSNPVLDVMKVEIGDDGIPDFGRGTKAIYDSQVLLRSWAILRDREAIEIPESVEEMIEAVYAQTIECPVTASASLRDYWNASALEHQESLEKDSRTAKITRIPAPFDEALFECGADFEEDNPEIHAGLQARTRLSEGPSVDVVLLEALDAASFDPDATPNRARAHFLLKRSVKISHAGVARALLNDGQSQPHGWERSALLRHHRVAKLDEHGTVVIDPGRYQLTLDSELGVLIGRLDSGGS